jgi:hypothetical protein
MLYRSRCQDDLENCQMLGLRWATEYSAPDSNRTAEYEFVEISLSI